MNPIKVLVVEDEVLIAETIKLYLEERGHIFLENATSYEEAVEMIDKFQPDIILLDIRLYGEKSGIDLAKYLSLNKPKLPYVFLTSHYDKNVLNKALATNPYGYLTKPINKESIWTTLEMVINNQLKINDQHDSLVVNDGNKTHAITKGDIMYIQAEHVYVNIITNNNNTILTRSSLTQIWNKLQSDSFIRCHRSYIINKKYVSSWTNTELIINGKVIPISRSNKNLVINSLKAN